MDELIYTAGQWLGLVVFFCFACFVIRRAVEEIRNLPTSLSPVATHDWDAPERPARNAQRFD